jgi:hypothetical protein
MMPLADILFLTIVVYLLYRFIFNFLLPVVKATRNIRQQFRNMQEPGNNSADNFSAGSSRQTFNGFGKSNPSGGKAQTGSTSTSNRSSKPPAEDYIDFEEIK